MALFGSATPISKIVADALPTFVGSALRVAIGAAVILPFVIRELRGAPVIAGRTWLLLGGIAVFGMFGFSVLMLFGMRLVPGVVGAVLMSATPAVTALSTVLFLGDRLGGRTIAAVACAAVGVAVMHVGQLDGADAAAGPILLGSGLVLAAVCCEAAYTLLGKAAMRSLSPLVVTLLGAAMALPLFAVPAGLEVDEADFGALAWTDWLAVAWWGAGTLGLGSLLWYSGVAAVKGGTAAGFMGVMPVSALVLSYVLLGEPFRWLHLAGFAIVFVGVLLVAVEHRRAAAAASDGQTR
ncbi:MAG: DMT family transporter [Alphaproteobacteria bacterium]